MHYHIGAITEMSSRLMDLANILMLAFISLQQNRLSVSIKRLISI